LLKSALEPSHALGNHIRRIIARSVSNRYINSPIDQNIAIQNVYLDLINSPQNYATMSDLTQWRRLHVFINRGHSEFDLKDILLLEEAEGLKPRYFDSRFRFYIFRLTCERNLSYRIFHTDVWHMCLNCWRGSVKNFKEGINLNFRFESPNLRTPPFKTQLPQSFLETSPANTMISLRENRNS